MHHSDNCKCFFSQCQVANNNIQPLLVSRCVMPKVGSVQLPSHVFPCLLKLQPGLETNALPEVLFGSEATYPFLPSSLPSKANLQTLSCDNLF